MIRKMLVSLVFGLTISALLVTGCKSQTKEEMVQEGIRLSQAGNPNGAIVLYKNALEKDPNYIEARYQLGVAYLETEKPDKAESELQKVLLQAPDKAEALLKLAIVQNRSNRPDEAIDTIQKYLADNPKSSSALESLGTSYGLKKEWAQAESSLREALILDPANVTARLGVAQLCLGSGRLEEARELLEEGIALAPREKRTYYALARLETFQDNKDAALQLYRTIVEIDSTDVEALYMAGILSLNAGDQAAAEALANDLRSRFPAHPAGARLLGLSLYAKGDLGKANVQLQESLKKMPDLAGFYFTGLTEYRLGQYELALNHFQKALDIQPEHVQSRVLIGMTLLQQKRLDDSINEINRALQLDDQNALAHNILGSAYLAKGDFDRAMVNLDRAIHLDPSLADAHVKKGLFNLAKGNPAAAESELIKAIDAAPAALNSRLLLSSLYLRQQNFSGALETMKQGLSGKPEDAMLYNYMAAAYFAQKKPDEAIAALTKAKELKPDYFTPYINLAKYYVSTADRDNAVSEYRQVLAIDPKNLEALLSLGALQEMMGDASGAAATYEQARQTQTSAGYLALASHLLRSKQPEKAREVLDEGRTALPEDPSLLELSGRAYLAGKQPAKAVEAFQALEQVKPGSGIPLLVATWLGAGEKDKALAMGQEQITKQPDAAYGYSLLAAIHEKEGAADQAEATLKQGLGRAKEPLNLSMQLASLYVGQQKTAQAMSLYEDIRKNNPRFVPAIFALGALYDGQGNKRKAVEYYREALDKAEGYTPALNNLAYLYADNYGSPAEALELALKAYRNEPSNPGIMDTLGYALFKNDRAKEAVAILNKAAEQLPKVAAVRLHQGQALLAAGQRAEAEQALKAAVEFGTESEANQARQLLSQLKKP